MALLIPVSFLLILVAILIVFGKRENNRTWWIREMTEKLIGILHIYCMSFATICTFVAKIILS